MILEPMPLLCVYNSLVQVAQHHLQGLWSLYRGLRRAMSDPASSKVRAKRDGMLDMEWLANSLR